MRIVLHKLIRELKDEKYNNTYISQFRLVHSNIDLFSFNIKIWKSLNWLRSGEREKSLISCFEYGTGFQYYNTIRMDLIRKLVLKNILSKNNQTLQAIRNKRNLRVVISNIDDEIIEAMNIKAGIKKLYDECVNISTSNKESYWKTSRIRHKDPSLFDKNEYLRDNVKISRYEKMLKIKILKGAFDEA